MGKITEKAVRKGAMKNRIKALFLIPIFLLLFINLAEAKDKWILPGIGEMEIPRSVRIEEGEQAALPFTGDKGIRLYFVRRGASEGSYYTLTYANPPDFSYGWATSQKLGIPYLLEIGEFSHKNDPVENQMDIIASYLNKRFISEGAVYKGTAPLEYISDKKNPRWEGDFVLPKKENNITYHTAYTVILQTDGYEITMGIISSDGEQKELTESLQKLSLIHI